MSVDLLLTDVTLATADEVGVLRVQRDTTIGISGETITSVADADTGPAKRVVSLGGRLVTPALVDCHTHLVFGGSRTADYGRRLSGMTYADIAAGGGGIKSTVSATRAATDEVLLGDAIERTGWLARSGVGTVEIKSGYGLNLDDELRMLRIARRVGESLPIRVTTSLLAAHTAPPEHLDDPDRYVTQICDEIIPAAAAEGLADSVDGFLETIAFDQEQIERVFAAAAAHDLPVRLHADQLSDLDGAAVAARHNALSADHLEHASEAGCEALAAAGTVAVLIPGASVFLDETARPPVAAMRRAGVRIAVATDLNPGSAPLGSLQLAMSLACTRFGLTPTEALLGATLHAAAAVGAPERGRVAAGGPADLAVWNTSEPTEIAYWMGRPLCAAVMVAGREAFNDGSVPWQ